MKTYGDRPIYVASLGKKGNIQGLLLAIESCYAKHPALTSIGTRGLLFGKLYKHTISPLFQKMLPFIFWENGPVILSQSPGKKSSFPKKLYQKLVKKIVEKAQKRDCYEIKFARPPFFDDHDGIFTSLGFQARKMGTILVNLDQPVEVLWKRINKHARRNIKKMEQNVEFVRVSKLGELKEFYDMHVESSQRAKVKIYPFSYFTSLWNHFAPHNKIVGFIARLKNKPIGALICLMHNKTIHEYVVADSDYARSNRIYANDILKWHIIKWAHERGFKYFDLRGVELYKIDAGDEKARNIYRFKSKWGGQLVEFHDYEKTLQSRKLTKLLGHFLSDSI